MGEPPQGLDIGPEYKKFGKRNMQSDQDIFFLISGSHWGPVIHMPSRTSTHPFLKERLGFLGKHVPPFGYYLVRLERALGRD